VYNILKKLIDDIGPIPGKYPLIAYDENFKAFVVPKFRQLLEEIGLQNNGYDLQLTKNLHFFDDCVNTTKCFKFFNLGEILIEQIYAKFLIL